MSEQENEGPMAPIEEEGGGIEAELSKILLREYLVCTRLVLSGMEAGTCTSMRGLRLVQGLSATAGQMLAEVQEEGNEEPSSGIGIPGLYDNNLIAGGPPRIGRRGARYLGGRGVIHQENDGVRQALEAVAPSTRAQAISQTLSAIESAERLGLEDVKQVLLKDVASIAGTAGDKDIPEAGSDEDDLGIARIPPANAVGTFVG